MKKILGQCCLDIKEHQEMDESLVRELIGNHDFYYQRAEDETNLDGFTPHDKIRVNLQIPSFISFREIN